MANDSDNAANDEAAEAPLVADVLTPLVYEELKRLAAHQLAGERCNHTLQATALVHEAYLRMRSQKAIGESDATKFKKMAANMIRRILVDHARKHSAIKRGDGIPHVALQGTEAVTGQSESDLIALHEAIEKLAKENPRQAEVVDLRIFGNLSIEEAAKVLDVGVRTVNNDWRFACAWLRRAMAE
jgi:RNA polymerase sigma-70 factor (ECF subfamily)